MTRTLPVATVLGVLLLVWTLAVLPMNYDQAAALADDGDGFLTIAESAFALDRPLLPAPWQVAGEFISSVFQEPPTAPRSLVYHAFVTLDAASLGFVLACLTGFAIAFGIVRLRVLDRALMPWVVASQAVPVLAIAPMVVVVLGNLGFTGILPKALITAWLSLFPIVTGMVTGLRSPERAQLDLLRTYNASGWQMLALLRWPASMPFLFPSLKLAATLSVVGAIVAELPTGAQAGLGARLLAGSYYGQTLQIWAALFMAGLLAAGASASIALSQALVAHRRGGQL